jgi:small conductance mechanosensitive channel
VVILAWGRYENALGYIGTATAATLLFLAAFGVAAHVIGWALARLDRAADGLREYHPAAEGFVRRSLSWLRLGLHALIWPVVLLGAAQAWGLPVLSIARSPLGRNLLGRTAVIVVTALVVFALIRISRGVADRLLYTGQDREPGAKRQTFVPLVRTTVLVIAVFSALIIILRQLGVDVGPILAGAGIISLGVGLGAQSLVKDVINGLFILLQDLVSVGDVADVGGKSGVVESVGLRTVRLRDLSGNVHTVPNSSIDTVTNMTKGYSRYVLDVGVAYREDVDQVMAVLTEIGEEMRTDETYGPDILEPLEIFGVNELGDSAVVVRARVTTKPIKQWGVGREFLRRIKIAFDQRGIEIPFPHQTVYMGQPKQGPAPPLEVRLKRADGET